MLRRPIVIVIAIVAAAAMMPSVASASHQAAIDQATKAASSWLELVDNGKYGQSWDHAAKFFRDAISKKSWERQVAAVRGPLGAVRSRKLKLAKYETSLPGAPDGQYVVIQYDTSFANKKTAIETITPKLAKDGKWHVSGYFIR